jgi:hypothetical protein
LKVLKRVQLKIGKSISNENKLKKATWRKEARANPISTGRKQKQRKMTMKALTQTKDNNSKTSRKLKKTMKVRELPN